MKKKKNLDTRPREGRKGGGTCVCVLSSAKAFLRVIESINTTLIIRLITFLEFNCNTLFRACYDRFD